MISLHYKIEIGPFHTKNVTANILMSILESTLYCHIERQTSIFKNTVIFIALMTLFMLIILITD